MKIRIRIHPDDYDKRANEQFYEQMALDGWILQKRWYNLSQFKKSEPQRLKFDIYYAEYNYVSDEERAEFYQKGRTVVNARSHTHVSYAPASENLQPVIKSNEDAANAILPLKNKSTTSPIPFVFIILFYFLKYFCSTDITHNTFSSLPLPYKIITAPELYIAAIVISVYILFLAIYERLRWKNAVKIFQSGENPDDGIRKKAVYIFSLILFGFSIIFIALFAFSNITNSEQDIPEVSDGIYLDVHDFGIADKITGTGYSISDEYYPNKITHRKTLSAEIYLTDEHYDINGKNVIIYQDVITYKSQKTALYAAELLTSEHHSEYQDNRFEKVYISVYISDEDCIAVINNTVYRITFISTDDNIDITTEQLLNAILKKQE